MPLSPSRDDPNLCKAEGNECMANGDFVGALKWYSQALALNPKEAALYSNRSFSFLRLGQSSRAVREGQTAPTAAFHHMTRPYHPLTDCQSP